MRGAIPRSALPVALAVALVAAGRVWAAPHPRSHAPAQTCLPAAASAVAPPDGFDPLAAPAADLQRYGFPLRPADPQALATWTNAMRHAKVYVASCFAEQVQARNNTRTATTPNGVVGAASTYQAGYLAHQQDNSARITKFIEVAASWDVPAAPSGSDNGVANYVDPYVGLGGRAQGTPLLQAGTDSYLGSPPRYDVWWEDYPDTANFLCIGNCPGLTANDRVYVDVRDNQNGTASFFWENVTTGEYTTAGSPQSAPHIDDSIANVLVERTNADWHFDPMTFIGAYIGAVQNDGALGSGSLSSFNVIRSNDTAARAERVDCASPLRTTCVVGDYFTVSAFGPSSNAC